MNILVYSSGTLIETKTIQDPDVYNDTMAFVMQGQLTRADITSIAYRDDLQLPSWSLSWGYLTQTELKDIMYCIGLQNTYELVYNYNNTDYKVYFDGDFNILEDNVLSVYKFNAQMIAVGVL